MLKNRKIHLDFHTGPDIPDVGRDFDAEAFGQALVDAKVNSITLFAKCHHGMLYYDTDRPERHPSLPRSLNLLDEQVEVCKRLGITTPIYISVQCDEYAAEHHPEWRAVNPDGDLVGRKPLEDTFYRWRILDMNSPYADYLADQIQEIVTHFAPNDTIFLDMCWDQPSVGRYAYDAMKKAGLDPADEGDRMAHARRVALGYMQRYNDLIAQCNGGKLPMVWYNSRPKTRLPEEKKFLQHIEIEALPTGGWGYTYFPLNVRFARNFDLPFIGMTGRFYKGWSDFGGIKPEAALLYECAQMLAHGGGCSIGDQLHPRGTVDAAAYALIGKVYDHVERCEPWCEGAKPVVDLAVMRNVEGQYALQPGDPLEGVVRLLQQTFHQFDFVHDQSDLSGYRAVIVPDGYVLTEAAKQRLKVFADAGGKIVLSGKAVLDAAGEAYFAHVGLEKLEAHDYATCYLRYDPQNVPGVGDTDAVLYEPTEKLTPAADAVGMGQIVEPYFQRSFDQQSGHCQTPPAEASGRFAATVGDRGIAFGFDLFRQYATHGNVHLKKLFTAAMDRLLPDPLVRSDAPSHVELTVTQLPDGRRVVHVVSFAPQRRTPDLDLVEEATPLLDVRVGLKTDGPATVTREPAGETLAVETDDRGYSFVTLTSKAGHDLLVFAQ